MLPFQQPIEINEEERLLKEGSMKEISTAAGLSFYWRLNDSLSLSPFLLTFPPLFTAHQLTGRKKLAVKRSEVEGCEREDHNRLNEDTCRLISLNLMAGNPRFNGYMLFLLDSLFLTTNHLDERFLSVGR